VNFPRFWRIWIRISPGPKHSAMPLRLIGKMWKTNRRPQASTERYYQCPNCGAWDRGLLAG
jgi:hypothetical protein